MKQVNFLFTIFLLCAQAHIILAMDDETIEQRIWNPAEQANIPEANSDATYPLQSGPSCIYFWLSNAVVSTIAGAAFGGVAAPLILCDTLAPWYTFQECDMPISKGDESQLRLMGIGTGMGAATGLAAGTIIIFPLAYLATKGINYCKKSFCLPIDNSNTFLNS